MPNCLLLVNVVLLLLAWHSYSYMQHFSRRLTVPQSRWRHSSRVLLQVTQQEAADTKLRTPLLTFEAAATAVRRASATGSDGSGSRVIAVEAWVSRRRPISNGLAFLDLACEDPDAPPLQALLKLQAFRPGGPAAGISSSSSSSSSSSIEAAFAAYLRVLQPGAKVRLAGRPGSTRSRGEGLLVVSDATLLGPPANPQFGVYCFEYLSVQLERAEQTSGSKPQIFDDETSSAW